MRVDLLTPAELTRLFEKGVSLMDEIGPTGWIRHARHRGDLNVGDIRTRRAPHCVLGWVEVAAIEEGYDIVEAVQVANRINAMVTCELSTSRTSVESINDSGTYGSVKRAMKEMVKRAKQKYMPQKVERHVVDHTTADERTPSAAH